MRTKKLIVEIVSALFILLWLYSAISKILDFETFKIQLGKSPLLTNFAGLTAIVVPAVEIAIALILLFKRTQVAGLYASLLLITMFTSYLIVILNFSYYIPCSCGGILTGLPWAAHVVFNLVFVILGIIAILLKTRNEKQAGNNLQEIIA